jgi:hypothetical protein
MALAAAGSWLRFALVRTPRIDSHGTAFLVASAVSGAGLILSGVCSLRLAPRAHRLSWRALWAWCAAAQLCAFLALALTSSDVFFYLCVGALKLSGAGPDAVPTSVLHGSALLDLISREVWVDEPSPYGPLFHAIAAGAAWIGERTGSPLWGSFWALKAVMFAAAATALAIAARHLASRRPAVSAEIFVPLALGPLVAWEISGQGHNDGLLFLVSMVFWVAAASSRHALAVVALAAGVVIKCTLAPLLALYLVLIARTSWRRALALGLLSLLVVSAAVACDWASFSPRAVLPLLGGNATRHAHSLADLLCLLFDSLGMPAASALAYRLVSIFSLLLWVALFAWTAVQARTVQDLARGYLLVMMAIYLTTPWFQPWYVIWVLPCLIVEADERWRRFIALFAVISVAQWILPLDPFSTVIADAWAATRLWGLLQLGRERSEAPEAAPIQMPEPL